MNIPNKWLIINFVVMLFTGAACTKESSIVDVKPPVSVDTTSHVFSFARYTFGGDGDFSSVNDVTIINDNLVYAVGEIYLPNAQGEYDPQAYGVTVWNGVEWKCQKLFVRDVQLVNLIRGIWVFDSTDIYLAAGSVVHWDQSAGEVEIVFSRLTMSDPNASVEKIWASSKTNIYGVGNAGTIVHFDGKSWKQLNSGTTFDIQDIWGAQNPRTGELEIFAVASHAVKTRECKLLHIDGTVVTEIDHAPVNGLLSAIWFVPGTNYFIGGDGLFEKKMLGQLLWTEINHNLTTNYILGIRGNVPNDIFATGGFGELLHYNGMNWRSFKSQTALAIGNYKRVATKGNLVVAVGWNDRTGVILMGRR